ncbi:MAG: chitobiase/beta-hexosaminidase C-terminal domain-containing protein, partial [Muribaculaceae bacterium]|nr:chitobiase/beta-hexosaminidase C-terminal domain-containing protein [Muribaculaceae bacterium]
MTVSSTNKPMDGGSNSATLFFSGSNSTSAAGAGVASGTGASSVSIDCSSLNLNTGYITASGAVRIWDVVVTYENTVPSVSAPVISGTTPFEGSTQVSISCGTTGASIYYTTDGSDPTTSSTPYSAPFTITETTTVKAIAVLGNDVSGIVEKVFTKKTIVNVSSIADFNALQ